MKLYVLVRRDLSKSQQAVQAGHAVASFLLNRTEDHPWDNGTLVYLGVHGEGSLLVWQEKLEEYQIDHYPFYEPYWENAMTAMAVSDEVAEEWFKDLPLL